MDYDFGLAKEISLKVYSNEMFLDYIKKHYLEKVHVDQEALDKYIIPNLDNGAFLKYFIVALANNHQDNYEDGMYGDILELNDMDINLLKTADAFIKKTGSLPYNWQLMDDFSPERIDEYTDEKWNNLKQNNCFKASQNYREDVEDSVIAKLWGLLGYDEASRLLSKVPNLTEEELSKLIQTDEQSFKQVFVEVYLVQGNLEYSSELIRKINVLGFNKKGGKNKVFEIYKSLNKYLESDTNLDLESLKTFLNTEVQNSGLIVSDKDKVLVNDMFTTINNRLSNDKLSRIESELKNRIGESFENIDITLQDIIQGQIKKQLNGAGKINQSELLSELGKEIMSITGEEEYKYSPQIRGKLNEILEFTKGYISEPKVVDTLNLSIGDILKEQKEKIGQGWIRKLQPVSPRLNKEQLEAIETSLGFKVDAQKQIQIQGTSDERLKELGLTREEYIKKAYELLSSTSNKELLIYNKAELMFDGISQPYSEKFAKYFIKHKEEIMDNPEYYQNLSRIHNNFESIIYGPNTRKIYESGKLELDDVLRILSEMKYENITTGEYNLAEVAAEVGLSESEFKKAQEIYNITSNRQYQTIPPMNESKGKFRGRLLRADDPLHIVVGNITLCCQKIEGAAESSMLHSAKEKNGGIFVIEKLDEEGNVTEIVTQSWTWRNKDRLCFDNIEVRQEGSLSEEEQEQILDIYKKAGEEAIRTDKKMFSRMLKDGKITQEMYDSLLLKQVTAGLGYNDLEILSKEYDSGEIEKANIVLPKEKYPYTDAASNQALLAQIGPEELKDIEEREKEGKGSDQKADDLEDIPLGYGNTREVIDLKGSKINRDVVSDISNIEKMAFRKKQQLLGRCETINDLAERYSMNLDSIQVSMSKDKDWYVIYTDTPDEIYVADMALLNGINSEKNEEVKTDLRSSGYELLEKTYMLLLKAAEDSKTLRFEATEDTSYINIQKAVEKGLAEVVEDYDTTFDDEGEIKMHNMVIKANLEAVRKELEDIRRIKQKIYEKRTLRGYEKGDVGSR